MNLILFTWNRACNVTLSKINLKPTPSTSLHSLDHDLQFAANLSLLKQHHVQRTGNYGACAMTSAMALHSAPDLDTSPVLQIPHGKKCTPTTRTWL